MPAVILYSGGCVAGTVSGWALGQVGIPVGADTHSCAPYYFNTPLIWVSAQVESMLTSPEAPAAKQESVHEQIDMKHD